ncbi:MAG: amidohydrolase [Acidobacteria bacterium]|nr:amidohydrolase [Acidobacteriota bacterium]
MIDAFCHIIPPKYEETRWARAGSADFAAGSPAHLQYVRTGRKAPNYEGLTSLDARFRMMDQFDGYRQIISLAGPPPEHIAPQASVELATIANDELAGLVAKHPDRFAGAAAAVPMNEPDRACREIERATGELGLCAVQIYTNVNGRPLDAPEFRVVFRTLAERRVPILLHPARGRTHADYAAERESKYLVWQVFGWPYESTAAMMRLVFGGIMQDHPGLRILVHHTVAMVPFFHGRMQSMFDMFAEELKVETDGRLAEPPLEYFRRFYGDIGAFSAGAVNVARDFLGADHLLFGSDAPFDATGGYWSIRASIESVRKSSCTEAEKRAIFTTNVERFFNLGRA